MSAQPVRRRLLGFLVACNVVVCLGTFVLSFSLVNEMHKRMSFENGIELTLRRLAVAVDNTDHTSKLYFHLAEEIQNLEDAFEKVPRNEEGEPIRFVQTSVRPLTTDAEAPASTEPTDSPSDTSQGPASVQDLTETLGKSLILRDRPSQADYAAAYTRALDKFRGDLNFEKVKADRYENYLLRNSYEQTSRYRKWSILALAVATLLAIGAFAGSLGSILHCAAKNYLERPPRLRAFFVLSIRPIISAIVALLTGYTLMFIASGSISLDQEATLFMPVSIYGFAFFMAINPYNSLNALYYFLRSQTQTFVLMGSEGSDAEEERLPAED